MNIFYYASSNRSYTPLLNIYKESAKRDIPSFFLYNQGTEVIFGDNLDNLNKSGIHYTLNGENLIGGILSITFHDILSQDLVIALDMKGYAISGGSACSSGSVKSSTTLREINMDEQLAERTVRISFGKNLKKKNIIGLSECIVSIINKNQESGSNA